MYQLPGTTALHPELVFDNDPSSGYSDTSSGDNGVDSEEDRGGHRDNMGCLISPHLDAPIIDDLVLLGTQLRLKLEQPAENSLVQLGTHRKYGVTKPM